MAPKGMSVFPRPEALLPSFHLLPPFVVPPPSPPLTAPHDPNRRLDSPNALLNIRNSHCPPPPPIIPPPTPPPRPIPPTKPTRATAIIPAFTLDISRLSDYAGVASDRVGGESGAKISDPRIGKREKSCGGRH
jgi:hypothetical protein